MVIRLGTQCNVDAHWVYSVEASLKKKGGTDVDSLDGMTFEEMDTLAESLPGVTAIRQRGDREFTKMRDFLNQRSPPIVMVWIDGNTGQIGRGNALHFVVVSGLSIGYQWDRGPGWQWVRLVNPFDNEVEYYTASDFRENWYVDGKGFDSLTMTYIPDPQIRVP